jgi:hypothetical protein
MEYFIHELDKYDIRVRAKTYAHNDVAKTYTHNNATHDSTKTYIPNTSDQLALFSTDNNATYEDNHDSTSNLWALKLKKDD